MSTAKVNGDQVKVGSLMLTAEEIRNGAVSGWQREVFDAFENDMISEERPFPCVFGVEGFKQGNLRYAFIEDPLNEQSLMQLRDVLIEYTEMFRTLGRMTSFATFFQPSEQALSLHSYEDLFWNVLRFLHENDPKEWPQEIPTNTDDKLWEFCFNGEPIFVVCNTPAHEKRQSRKSKTFMITFQPRWVFEDLKGEKGEKGRAVVRSRLAVYDEVEVHPAMGFYGDEVNREWKQYFIHDTNEEIHEGCPFHAMMAAKGEKEKLVFDRVQVISGTPLPLEQAILKLIPKDHYVSVQNDSANVFHPDHKHAQDETLMIVRGSVTITVGDEAFECKAGDRLLLPKHTVHSSLAGEQGCLYLIMKHEEPEHYLF